jgi:hypothetical protein
MKVPLFRLAIFLFGLGLAASPEQAWAQKVTLTYVGYLAGAPVLDLIATIEAPKGVVPPDGAYSVVADIATTGNFAKLYPYRQTLRSEGDIASGLPNPKAHSVRQVAWSRAYSVALAYGADGVVSITADPPTLQSKKAEAEGYANNTIDPASAVVALSALFAERKNCGGRIAVFDGTRRFDLQLVQGGVIELNALPKSYYTGSAAQCQLTPSLKAGFQMNALAQDLYPRAATLWLAPAVADFPSVPVRISATNAFGEMVLDLVAAKAR